LQRADSSQAPQCIEFRLKDSPPYFELAENA